MKDSRKIVRHRHSAALKALVLSECAQPGASVAGISRELTRRCLNPR